jgi:hypothetical protein
VSVLVSLALIPLALTGAFILFLVSWWLLPYAITLCGGLLVIGGLAMDTSQTGNLGAVLALFGAALLIVGGLWSRARYANRV